MTEKRQSRTTFTKTLEAMCRRLDEAPNTDLVWEHPLVHMKFTSAITITSLWAVGSYARGAQTCGDLDLVAELTLHSGPPPPTYEVSRTLFKSTKGVRLHLGTPAENSSNVEHPGAIQIWQGPGCDWQSAIAGITPDAAAGHFSRPTDRIPFRPEQLACSIDDLEDLLEQEDQQRLRWRFTSLGAAVPVEPLSEDELELSEAVRLQCGRKTQDLLPLLITYLRKPGVWTKPYLRPKFSKSGFVIGGAMVLVGQPFVPTDSLDLLTTSELLVVPHLSARGPNGLWSIERGDLHPLVRAAGKLHVWALYGEDGKPDFYRRVGADLSKSAAGVDLFTSPMAAQEWIDETAEDSDQVLHTHKLTARELLSCLSRVDIVAINMTDYAMTRLGCRVACGTCDIATIQELLAALAGTQ